MIRRPPRSTRVRSSAASDVYKRQKGEPRTTADTSGRRTSGGIAGSWACGLLTSGGRDGRIRVRVSPPCCREPSRLLPTRQWSPSTGLALRSGWSQRTTGYWRHPRRPCHNRAIHTSQDRSPADNHGQHSDSSSLHRCPSSQVTILADLALGAGARSIGRLHR